MARRAADRSSPLNQQPATAVQVVSNTKITAITYPFTTVGQSFFVDGDHPVGWCEPDHDSGAVFTFTQAPP